MAKHVVYPQLTFTHFIEEPVLKRLALFFDTIYVGKGGLDHLMSINPSPQHEYAASINYEKSVYTFLLDKGIVKTYPFLSTDFDR